jgi:hypothetical protein
MHDMTMGKDGGDKGEGKDGGKKSVIAPIDSGTMQGRQGMSRNQMNRSLGHGNAGTDRGMERGMERSLDGLNR